MIFSLLSPLVKGLLSSKDNKKEEDKKINNNKLLGKEDSESQKVSESDSSERKRLVGYTSFKRKSISSKLFLLGSSNQTKQENNLNYQNKKNGIRKVFNNIIKTLENISNIISSKNNLKKEEIINDKKQLNLEEKKIRESKLEKKKVKSKTSSPIKLSGDKFGIGRYIKNLLIASIIIAIFNNVEKIIGFFTGLYEDLKNFIKKVGEFLKPIWNFLKWITKGGLMMINKIKRFLGIGNTSEDEEYAKRIDKEFKKIEDIAKSIYKFFGMDDGKDNNNDDEDDRSSSPEGLIIRDDSEALRELGLSQKQWNAYKQGIANIERAEYNQMGGAGGKFAGRYQMGDAAITDAAKILGIQKPSRSQFLNDPELQERMYLGYTVSNFRALKIMSPEFAGMSKKDQIKTLPMAQLGVGNLATQLSTGVTFRDQNQTPTTRFSTEVAKQLKKVKNDPNERSEPPNSPSPKGRMVKFGGNTYYQKPDGITLTDPSAAPPEIRDQSPVSIDRRDTSSAAAQIAKSPKPVPSVSEQAYYEKSYDDASSGLILVNNNSSLPQIIGGGQESDESSGPTLSEILNTYYQSSLIASLYKRG